MHKEGRLPPNKKKKKNAILGNSNFLLSFVDNLLFISLSQKNKQISFNIFHFFPQNMTGLMVRISLFKKEKKKKKRGENMCG